MIQQIFENTLIGHSFCPNFGTDWHCYKFIAFKPRNVLPQNKCDILKLFCQPPESLFPHSFTRKLFIGFSLIVAN